MAVWAHLLMGVIVRVDVVVKLLVLLVLFVAELTVEVGPQVLQSLGNGLLLLHLVLVDEHRQGGERVTCQIQRFIGGSDHGFVAVGGSHPLKRWLLISLK